MAEKQQCEETQAQAFANIAQATQGPRLDEKQPRVSLFAIRDFIGLECTKHENEGKQGGCRLSKFMYKGKQQEKYNKEKGVSNSIHELF